MIHHNSPGHLINIKKRMISLVLPILIWSTLMQINMPESQASIHAAPHINISEESGNADIMTLRSQLVIDAPAPLVWATMTNYNALKDILPGYRKCQLVQTTPKLVDVALSVSPFLPVYNYRVHVQEYPQKFALQFNRISGDFKEFAAMYQLIPKENGNKTLLIYQLRVNPGIRLPGREMILKSTTEKTLEGLQSYAEQEYHKRVIGQR